MKKFAKRELSERENMMLLTTRGLCGCLCGCNGGMCSCPPIPTHQVQYDQESQGKTVAASSNNGRSGSDGSY